MPPTFILIFFVGPALLLGLIAMLASFLFGLGKRETVWVHLTRGVFATMGALVGYIAGGLVALIVGGVTRSTSPLPSADVGFGIMAGLAFGALVGGVLALPFVRLAYNFIGWLANKTGVAGGAA